MIKFKAESSNYIYIRARVDELIDYIYDIGLAQQFYVNGWRFDNFNGNWHIHITILDNKFASILALKFGDILTVVEHDNNSVY